MTMFFSLPEDKSLRRAGCKLKGHSIVKTGRFPNKGIKQYSKDLLSPRQTRQFNLQGNSEHKT